MTDTTEDTAEDTAEIILEAPRALTFSHEATVDTGAGGESAEEKCSERVARLLEAGDYPDKGLHLTEADLDGIVARFAADAPVVPVKVEHVDSPLDPLGHVQRVWREGAALFGTLAFPADLAAFLRRRGAAKLSVGLQRTPLALREVSLVLKPRVAGAVLMSTDEAPTPGPSPASGRGGPDRERSDSSEASALSDSPLPLAGEGRGVGAPDAEIVRLKAELTRRDVDAQVAAFKAQGRLVPAAEEAARALLASDGEALVTLSDGPEPVARVFRRFLEAQPPVVSFGEAVDREWQAAYGFTQDEHTFLSKRLGVDPARVAALIREEQARTKNEKGEGDAH